jgi:uncharacterized membrane protein YraQ (UPF0718 family)
MVKLIKIVKRYRFFLIFSAISVGLLVANPVLGKAALGTSLRSGKEMIMVIPPIFILLGLLDVWVKRETMIKYMGEKSGITGALFAFFLGTAAAGPLYAAFPIAGILLKKGSKLSNIFIFLGTWSTAKIPMLLMEASYMGMKFTVIRLILSLIGIASITFIMEKALTEKDKKNIYDKAMATQDP